MTRALRIGRWLGIDIEVDYTWFLIFFLLVYLLATPTGPFGSGILMVPLGLRLAAAVGTALLFFLSVLLHELSHSVVALRSGMRITGITLFIFGGVSKLADEPPTPGIEFRMAIAGPAASFVLGVAFFGLFALTRTADAGLTSSVIASIFLWLAVVNVSLGVFNLLPGFPLDGGRVLRAGLWRGLHNLGEATRIASASGRGLGALMIVGGVLLFLTGHGGNGVWLALVGWFLSNAASSSYQQMIVRQTLAGVPVTEVMTPESHQVSADEILDDVIHEHVLAHTDPAYPVVRDGELIGALTLASIRAIPREQRGAVTAGAVVTPLAEAPTISPDADAWEALRRMSETGDDALLVTSDHTLLGVVSRGNLLHLMRRRLDFAR